MKRVKIMLLSLALFAVVGAALAFKAKFDQDWCIGTPYFDINKPQPFYCTHNNTPGAVVTTTTCGGNRLNVTNVEIPGLPLLTYACTSIPDINNACNTRCPALELTELDGE